MTSPVDTSVKYLHSAMVGAPVLSGTAGALIAVLDACLVNGWGLKSVDSLVIVNNVATTNIASGHSAEVGSVVEIAGATPAALNGEQKVTAVTATSVSFATSGLTDQTATGAITLKLASLGWSKPFSGTNLAAYRSNDVTGTRMFLRVDDRATQNARVSGYENLTAISTGTGPFPTNAQQAGGGYWSKSDSASTEARSYILCGDRKGFYVYVIPSISYPSSYQGYYFGEINSVKSNDPFSTYLSFNNFNIADSVQQSDGIAYSSSSNYSTQCLTRSSTGLGSAVQVISSAPTLHGNIADYISGQSSNAGLTPFPNLADGGLYLSAKNLSEYATRVYRGSLPGSYLVPQAIPFGQFATGDSVMGISGLPGKILKAVSHYAGLDGGGVSFVDSTGPWR